ncbi:CLIP domain-containing serine protease B9 isoform X2 [Drosophila grimshawi]|uniref:CLIP domain-containing serine protease B9 isoform X2 n=1 Tax=Drosophila grimshawi TaxID=7222 RepID=UPI000C870F32|nr:CLIP domain-containing serine protease B9 isoform X2 [Drosophila grimshawi]
MAIASQTVMLRLTLLSLCLHIVLPQRLPPNDCNHIFHYQRRGDIWIGHGTPPVDGLRSVHWVLRFMAHGASLPGTVGGLEAYPDKATALQNMHNGGRAEISVGFYGHWDELPKIVEIKLNDDVLCTSSGYGAPSTTLTRELTMYVTTSTVTNTLPHTPRPTQSHTPRPPGNPVFGPQWGGPNFAGNPFLSGATSRKPATNVANVVNVPNVVPVIHVDTQASPARYECGVEGLVGLQIGGDSLPRGRFPWLAALYHDSNVDVNKIELSYKCVTTVVSRRTVITAAHCVYGLTPAQLRVYVGRHDITMHPEKDATLMAVEMVRTHPDFVGNLVPDSDLALLVLVEQVQYSIYVRPICLWTSSTTIHIGDSEQTSVAGWGTDSNSKPTRFPTTVNVRTVSNEECLRGMLTAKDFLTPRTLCAGNSQGHGPCLGDSGGGLMVLRNGRWYVRGIVSLAQRAGNSCDLTRFVIYCDVARHLDWIERNIVR